MLADTKDDESDEDKPSSGAKQSSGKEKNSSEATC